MDQIDPYYESRDQAHKLYRTFDKVKCPAFQNELVYFRSGGFNHLVYKRKKKLRNQKDQIVRFKLLKEAKLILENSVTFQEYEKRYGVQYWGFVGIVNKIRIKIVVRKIGNGKKEFYSVIPGWFIKK